jgi:hypothetical protein
VSASLFLLRAYPDVDHLVPLAWKMLEQGDHVVMLFERPFPARDDYRLQFLSRSPGFELVELPGIASPSYPAALAARLRWRGRRLHRLLEAWRIEAVVLDWGYAVKNWSRIEERLPRLADRRFWWRALQRPMTRIRLLGDHVVPPFRAALIAAARARGLPVFCLPHGVQLRMNPDGSRVLGRGPGGAPYDDGRRVFAACVFPAEYDREIQVRRFGLDPARAHVWGSLRFSSEWSHVLREICPPAQLPACREGQARVVFFLPKWHRRADEQGTFDLLRSIGARSDIQLVLRTHARPGRSDLPAPVLDDLRHRPDVILTQAHSPALIGAADAVIAVNSSIALDALLQRKPLIYAGYLHGNRLVFDELGGCLRAGSAAEVHRLLDAVAASAPPAVDAAEVDRVLRTVVYGGREPFDVLAHYYREIRRHVDHPRGDPPDPVPASAPTAA